MGFIVLCFWAEFFNCNRAFVPACVRGWNSFDGSIFELGDVCEVFDQPLSVEELSSLFSFCFCFYFLGVGSHGGILALKVVLLASNSFYL